MKMHNKRLRPIRQVSVSNQTDPTIVRTTRSNQSRNTFRTILTLVIFVAIVFIILLILFVVRQNSTVQSLWIKEDSQDKEKVNETEKRIFDSSIDAIWENLLRLHFNRSNPEHLQPIRIEVFKALRYLSSRYKHDLIVFLYERRLIRSDIPLEQRLDLRGADLNRVEFKNMNLDYLYLPEITTSNSHFSECQLKKATFQGSLMDNSRFTMCLLEQATFSGASLKGSSFINNSYLSTVDFINTDLLRSNINTSELDKDNFIFNTRFPDGSFPRIDSKELVNDGDAEQQCATLRSHSWRAEAKYPPLTISHKQSNSCFPVNAIDNENRCYFHGSETSRFIQEIDLTGYSTLIDSDHAWYHLSSSLGCSNTTNGSAIVELHFASEGKVYENHPMHLIKHEKSWGSFSNYSAIPKGIRTMKITIGVDIRNSAQNPSVCCAIDDVHLNIHRNGSIHQTDQMQTTTHDSPATMMTSFF